MKKERVNTHEALMDVDETPTGSASHAETKLDLENRGRIREAHDRLWKILKLHGDVENFLAERYKSNKLHLSDEGADFAPLFASFAYPNLMDSFETTKYGLLWDEYAKVDRKIMYRALLIAWKQTLSPPLHEPSISSDERFDLKLTGIYEERKFLYVAQVPIHCSTNESDIDIANTVLLRFGYLRATPSGIARFLRHHTTRWWNRSNKFSYLFSDRMYIDTPEEFADMHVGDMAQCVPDIIFAGFCTEKVARSMRKWFGRHLGIRASRDFVLRINEREKNPGKMSHCWSFSKLAYLLRDFLAAQVNESVVPIPKVKDIIIQYAFSSASVVLSACTPENEFTCVERIGIINRMATDDMMKLE